MANKTKIKKKSQKHQVTNWHQYNNILKRRSSLELWISSEIESIWYEANRINDGTGTPREYSDAGIRLAYELKLCFKQPLRQPQGFINSIFIISNLSVRCPDYTTLSRRCKTLDLKMPIVPKSELDNLEEKIFTIDSTGLKQYGRTNVTKRSKKSIPKERGEKYI